MAQTRLKSGNLHMVGGDNGSDGNVLKSKGDGTMEWGEVIINPTFSSFDYPGDDTALDPAGGQSLVINGGGFNPNVTVTIGGTTPSSITRNSATQLTVTTPAKSAGSQALVITNTDGGSASASVSYNGIPAFTNAAGSLASVKSGTTINVSAAATEPDGGAITYAVTSGALPSGVSLNTSTGAITGTAPDVSASTTSNFTVTATDNENQSTARAYSITVTPPLPSEHFGIVTYTGNATARSFTSLGFKPDLVLTKSRSYAEKINVFDSTRGVTKRLYLTDTHSEAAQANSLTSFNNDGWSIGTWGDMNQNSQTYVSWCFKANGGTTSSNTAGTITSTVQANPTLGFSIVKWDGTGAINTVGHGLSAAPELILNKGLDSTADWQVYSSVTGNGNKLALNTNAASSSTTRFDSTSPTSSVFTLRDVGLGTGQIAYCFHSVDGFSKIGSYTGNGNANGPIIETGFEPAFIMVKRYNATSNWVIYDNKRNTTNPRYSYLMANETSAEAGSAGDAAPQLDFFSNGFRPSGTEGYVNADGDKYIYIAFAADPDTTAPTLADSFNAVTYTGSGTQRDIGTGFKPGMVWWKSRDSGDHNIGDIIRGKNFIRPNSTIAQYGATDQILSYNDTSYTIGTGNDGNQSSRNWVSWAWKADDNEPTITQTTTDIDAIAIYKFEDNTNDVTGNFNASSTSNITYNASGKFNKSAEFNGSSSTITLPIATSDLGTGSACSISWWWKPNTSGTTIDFLFEANAADVFMIHTGGGAGSQGLRVGVKNTSETAFQLDVTNAYTTGVWQHHVATFGNGKIKLYENGNLKGSLDYNGTIKTISNIAIGNRPSNSYWYSGELDQVRIYNGELDAASVTNLYNETTSQNNTLDIGTDENTSIESIVSANANAGFSIVKYKGDGATTAKIPHGLSAAPEMVFVKRTDSSSDWYVWATPVMSITGSASDYMVLNSSAAKVTAGSATNLWGGNVPSATTIGVGDSGGSNASGGDYIAYCFHSVSGYSKIGSYTGNGSTQSITGLGFQPDWVLIKETSAAESWRLFDSVRGVNKRLFPDTDSTESTASDSLTAFGSDGFSLGSSAAVNQNAQTYIYMAFKIN